MATKVQQYADEFPSVIRRALNGLGNENAQAVIVALLKNGGLAFSEIKEELEIHQQDLSTALDRLQDGGLVVKKDSYRDDKYKTLYQTTEFGKVVLDSLFETIQPGQEPFLTHGRYDELRDGEQIEKFYQIEQVNKTDTTKSALDDVIEYAELNNDN